MGFFDRFRQRPVTATRGGPGSGLPQLCYGMAYFMLPPMLEQDAARTLGYFRRSDGGARLYALACATQEVEPDAAVARLFHVHTGTLTTGEGVDVLEYPGPPQLDLRRLAHEQAELSAIVLAPFFSAIVRASEGLEYYVLGQRPYGGTTLRKVTPGMNMNLGEGPEPELGAFLAALTRR